MEAKNELIALQKFFFQIVAVSKPGAVILSLTLASREENGQAFHPFWLSLTGVVLSSLITRGVRDRKGSRWQMSSPSGSSGKVTLSALPFWWGRWASAVIPFGHLRAVLAALSPDVSRPKKFLLFEGAVTRSQLGGLPVWSTCHSQSQPHVHSYRDLHSKVLPCHPYLIPEIHRSPVLRS